MLHNLPVKCFEVFETFARKNGAFKESGDLTPLSIQCLTLGIKAGLAKWEAVQFPIGEVEQESWVLKCLLHSTRGFSRPGVAAKVCEEVRKLLKTTVAGNEREHMLHLLQFGDFRGSEVSLRDGTVHDGSRQVIPYPAMVWAWRSEQAYKWHSPHHINVLELIAFFNYLRCCVLKVDNHSCRLLHVLDSRVVSCVLAKGRSSSSKLNRVLRRLSALMLASDVYVFPLWTVSGWDFADFGTRALCPAVT